MDLHQALTLIKRVVLITFFILIFLLILAFVVYFSILNLNNSFNRIYYDFLNLNRINDSFFVANYEEVNELINDINLQINDINISLRKFSNFLIKKIFFNKFDERLNEIGQIYIDSEKNFKKIVLTLRKFSNFSLKENLPKVLILPLNELDDLQKEFYKNKKTLLLLLEKLNTFSLEFKKYQSNLKQKLRVYFGILFFLILFVSLFVILYILTISIRKIKLLTNTVKMINKGENISLLENKSLDKESVLYKNIKEIILKNGVLNRLKEEIISFRKKLAIIEEKNLEVKDELLGQKQSFFSIVNHFRKLKDSTMNVSDNILKTNFVTLETRDKTTSSAYIIRNTLDGFKSLSETASKIFRVLKLIASITAQTELLSLSASIESARAGEFGKGFNIVANEIRKLSESTILSTKEISIYAKQIIKIIRSSIGKTDFSKDALNAIEESIKELSDEIKKVADIAEIHSKKCIEIGEELESISSLNNELASSLDKIIDNLKELFERIEILFKISDKINVITESKSRKIKLVEP